MMKTLTKEMQDKISPQEAVNLLKEGNRRFVDNLKVNRNLLQQMNETREGQHPFAVIISCMDSRTSAELIFDQGLGDVFSIRIAGNVVNEDIVGSTEFGTKVVGSKVVLVLGHTACGAVKGAIADVQLGSLHYVTNKIKRCIPKNSGCSGDEMMSLVTKENVKLGMQDLRDRSDILKELENEGKIKIVGGVYDIASGKVEFFD
jgi:carbonic anhydrase